MNLKAISYKTINFKIWSQNIIMEIILRLEGDHEVGHAATIVTLNKRGEHLSTVRLTKRIEVLVGQCKGHPERDLAPSVKGPAALNSAITPAITNLE